MFIQGIVMTIALYSGYSEILEMIESFFGIWAEKLF